VDTSKVPVGNYPFTVIGAVGSITRTTGATLRVGDFGAATIAPGGATISVGQSAVFGLTISSSNGFTDSVNLACSPTVNGHATNGVSCSFSPAPAAFDASGNLSAKMTVSISSVPRSGTTAAQAKSQERWTASLIGLLVASVVLMTVPKRRRIGIALGVVCLLGIGNIVACGGGGGGGSGPAPTPIPTPTPTPQPAVVKIDVLGASTTQTGQTQKTLTSITVTVQ
jgi:hypothetical protein